jgi:hypothetical protein
MKTQAILLVLVLSGLLGCAAKNESMTEADTAQVQSISAQPAILSPDLYSNGITKLIKTAEYRFQVEDVRKSSAAIEAAVRKFPSYISASDMRLDNPLLEYKMTIRVQNEFFQDLLKEIDGEATYFNQKVVKTEDVSKQFVDLESRLKSKREVEARYMEILRKNAGTVEEIFDAEKQIGQLHEEIEATISRINFLKDEVRYSTIELEFYQTVEQNIAVDDTIPFGRQFGEAFTTGWSGVVVLAIGAVYLWPMIVFVFCLYLLYRFKQKRKVVIQH